MATNRCALAHGFVAREMVMRHGHESVRFSAPIRGPRDYDDNCLVKNMTPALVLSKQGVELAVGASGGRRITNCVTQLIMKVLDYGMGPQEAIDSPRIDCAMPYTSVDPRIEEEVQAALQGRGHRLKPIAEVLLQEGFASFASPVAISRNKNGELRAGVDTFHTAYAEGLR